MSSGRRLLLLVTACALLSLSGPAWAVEPVNSSLFGNVAIKGYDPVAYFQDGKPVKGSSDHEFEWQGAIWRFATAAHRDAFATEPERYAPQYGGYCAYAISQGRTANIDPEAWKVVDGKLYLNYSSSIQETWEAEMEHYIELANTNWPKLLQD